MLLKGDTAIDGFSATSTRSCSPRRRGLCRRRRLGKNTDLQRIGPDRLGDVLEFQAEIGHREIKPSLDLPVSLLGEHR